MLDHIQRFLSRLVDDDPSVSTNADRHEIAIATAALLVNCARADGHDSPHETERLMSILTGELELSEAEAQSVREIADERERDAIDIHRFTRVLHARLDRDERKRVVGWMWEIAQADGRIDADESNTVDLAARLLDVEVHDRVALRQAAQNKFGARTSSANES